ncbi:MAG: hypothetical protein ABMA26_16535 [Limisphaerales bacterium]
MKPAPPLKRGVHAASKDEGTLRQSFPTALDIAPRSGLKPALKVEDLPIARRLFLTATPRHCDVAKKDKFGESKAVFSMDVPGNNYGQVAHRLPFGEAAKARDWACPCDGQPRFCL